jgi:hypothetical protein
MMVIKISNPYSGEPEETCSVSFATQQKLAETDVSGKQTEAQYYKSKQLGEWGVIVAKMQKGEIPNGTKVLTYNVDSTGISGYFYVKNNQLHQVSFYKGKKSDKISYNELAKGFIEKDTIETAIPQAVSAKPKPEPVPITVGMALEADQKTWKDGEVLAVNANGNYVTYLAATDQYIEMEKTDLGYQPGKVAYVPSYWLAKGGWFLPDGKKDTPKNEPKEAPAPKPAPSTLAAPTATPPVNPGSTSPGSMTHEDVAAIFVKVKDDLAKEKGLNIKGANPELDAVVYEHIGDATGYTPAEVKAKIDAYKAAGNKLSALKKKVLAGTKKVPDLKQSQPYAEPAKDFKPLPKPDPKPNGVPTQASQPIVNAVKTEVKKEAEAKPSKVYSEEDISAQYIIAKDAVVAASNGKWTLYTKSDEMDAKIYGAVELLTGYTPAQTKQAIANYLASGKKLSALKKALAKQGAFTPKADTLKSGPSKKSLADKAKEVDAKAEAGYTPTPTPATSAGPKTAGTDKAPPMDTGKPAPKKVGETAQESGDISGVSKTVKSLVFGTFKDKGSQSWLSSGPASNYDGFAAVQAFVKAQGQDLTLLQIIRIVDEEGANKAGVANGKLFEKQVATWLTTPAGTKHIKDNEKKLIKEAEAAKKAAELAKAAKEMEANQPPLPADSAQYQPWDLDKARRVSRTWLDRQPWTDKERRDLVHYTGSAYSEMNGYLRSNGSSSISQRSKTAIDGAKAGMRPTTEPILVQRGTGLGQFKTLGIQGGYGSSDGDLLFGAVGKVFKDEGFLSTSAGGRAAFGGQATLEIECPVGTPMAYVAPISKYPHENEMLLQAGMEYQILHTRKENGRYVVRMRVVNWPGKGA